MLTVRDRRDERGAVALLMAIAMVGLCVAAAMVVDLGLLRVDRQEDKSAQDSAAMAGANGLVPDVASAGSFHPFAGVCQAINYLKVNDDRFSSFSSSTWRDGNGGTVAGDGCDSTHADLICTPDSPATWARWTGVTSDGESTVVIQSGYKVTGPGITPDATFGNIADVTGGDFAEDDLAAFDGDTGAATYGGCDQVAVIIGETKSTTLGSPAASTMGTRVRSVGRVHIDPPKSPFALLILERHNCQVLVNGTGGSPPAKINVNGFETHPGLIHSDSDATADTNGDGSPDNSSCNKPVLIGQTASGIVAHEAPEPVGGGAPGQISMVAGSNQTDGIANVYAGPAPGSSPITNSLVTRSVLDAIYLEPVRTAIQASKPYFAAAASGVPPSDGNSWTTVTNCPSGTVAGEYILIKNCNAMNGTVVFPDAKRIIWPGRINGGDIKMPKAARVYVVGVSSPAGVTVGTTFAMNGGSAPLADPCPSTYQPSAQRSILFVKNGNLKSNGGLFKACNTTVVLLGGDPDGCLPTDSGTYLDTAAACPGPSTGNGQVDMSGGANVEWTAPNLIDDELPSGDPANEAGHQVLEDLALWTESGGVQGLGGGGTVHLAGVFAAPNADPLKINGTPTWEVDNSQYVVRRFEDDGGGTFNMRPSPSLPVAPPEVSFYLVR